MRKALFLAAAMAVSAAFVPVQSQAMPLASSQTGFQSADVTLVAGGCGLGFHRGPYGGCRPNGGAVIVAPGAVVVERPVVVVRPGRVCPVGFSWRYGRCRPL